MNLEDLGGKIAGGLEVVFHHPLKPFTDYHMWVDDTHTVCRGSWPKPYDLQWLRLNAIELVVNFCKERNQDKEVKDAGMSPINLEVLDGSAPSIDQAVMFFRIATSGSKVYGHCEAGHGRTGCFFAYLRVMLDKWTPEAALQEALFIAGGKLEPNQIKWIKEIK